MFPPKHIIFGFLFAIFLFSIYPSIGWIGLILIWISSFMIDIDHYIYAVIKTKNVNPIKATKWCYENSALGMKLSRKEKRKIYTGFYFLHGIEILVILFLLIFVNKVFLFIFIGVGFHFLLDMIDQPRFQDRINKFSVIYDYFKFKKLNFIRNIK